jgi:hypothetical protein
MTNPTSNFGWQMPTASDLVTDLPADFEVFGQAVDTSLADLKGGTTDQVLAKNSNTDMDFKWVTSDDANAIQNSIVDAKGDLIAASAADTPARLAVGNNGETLVADSSTSTGLRYQSNFAAGKNCIINGAFNVWQRGTSFSNPANGAYTSDRFLLSYDGSGSTRTISQQAFTPGTAPAAGYESQYFWRANQTVAGTATYFDIRQSIENVTTFAGQTITISFWAKAAASTTISIIMDQDFGSGGSSRVFNAISSTNITATTSWQRFSYTASVASISGKTIGTSSYLQLILRWAATSTFTVDIWGVQIEASNTATAFQTATGTIQGELAACQRYYYRFGGLGAYQSFGLGYAKSTTLVQFPVPNPVTMRANPSSIDFSTLICFDGAGFTGAVSALVFDGAFPNISRLQATVTGATTNRPYELLSNNSTSGYVGINAEL